MIVAPVEHSAEGVLVVGKGLPGLELSEPVRLVFEEGRVVSIEGDPGDEADVLLPFFGLVLSVVTLAEPPTMVPGSTDRVTTAPAATTAPSPTVTPGIKMDPIPTNAFRQIRTGATMSRHSSWVTMITRDDMVTSSSKVINSGASSSNRQSRPT